MTSNEEFDPVERELMEQFLEEMKILESTGYTQPFRLKPSECWMLLATLQLALRHPAVGPSTVGAFALSFARELEQRLCHNRPAMAEIARRGWHDEQETLQ